MKITIQGQDYTAALDAVRPLTDRAQDQRALRLPAMAEPCQPTAVSRRPRAFQTLAVTGDDGTAYFTGYIAVSPLPEYAGLGMEGPRYRTAIQAVSDELLLDQLLMPPSAGRPEETAGALLASLVTHTGSTALSTQQLSLRYRWATSLPIRARTGARARGRPRAWRGPRIAR